MKILGLDIETANEKRSSICSLAIAEVSASGIEKSHHWYIKPLEERFASMNVFKHNITAETVRSSPQLPEIWNEISQVLSGQIVVAHNASFDMYALRDAAKENGLEMPEFNFYCTMLECKKKIQLPKYSLPVVCKHFNISQTNHHNAVYDAQACAQIAWSLALNFSSSFRKFPFDLEKGSTNSGSGFMFKLQPADLSGIEIYNMSEEVTPGMFKDKNIVVTGEFVTMTRQQAEAYVIEIGAKLSSSINGKTSMVVIGKNPGPSKIEKIKLLNEKSFVPVIDENEYIEVLEAINLR